MKALIFLAALAAIPAQATEPVWFRWFEYAGHDAVHEAPLPARNYRNPILAGYYPELPDGPELISRAAKYALAALEEVA